MYIASIPGIDNLILHLKIKEMFKDNRNYYYAIQGFFFFILSFCLVYISALIIVNKTKTKLKKNIKIYEKLFIALMVMFSFAILKLINYFSFKNIKFDILFNLVIMGSYIYILANLYENVDKIAFSKNTKLVTKVILSGMNITLYLLQISISIILTLGAVSTGPTDVGSGAISSSYV